MAEPGSPAPDAQPAPEAEKESFAALLEESLGQVERLEGTVLKGIIIAIEGDSALIDVGLKSEGRVALKEFAEAGQPPEVKVGDEVEVYLDRMENKNGEAVLSREKARREASVSIHCGNAIHAAAAPSASGTSTPASAIEKDWRRSFQAAETSISSPITSSRKSTPICAVTSKSACWGCTRT